MALEKELQYYDKIKADLLIKHKGKYALIKGEKLIGIFDSELKAYEAGVEKFGSQSFLIKHIISQEELVEFPALALGVIYART